MQINSSEIVDPARTLDHLHRVMWIAGAVLIGPCDYAEAAIAAAALGAGTPKRAEHIRRPICPARIGLECDCNFAGPR